VSGDGDFGTAARTYDADDAGRSLLRSRPDGRCWWSWRRWPGARVRSGDRAGGAGLVTARRGLVLPRLWRACRTADDPAERQLGREGPSSAASRRSLPQLPAVTVREPAEGGLSVQRGAGSGDWPGRSTGRDHPCGGGLRLGREDVGRQDLKLRRGAAGWPSGSTMAPLAWASQRTVGKCVEDPEGTGVGSTANQTIVLLHLWRVRPRCDRRRSVVLSVGRNDLGDEGVRGDGVDGGLALRGLFVRGVQRTTSQGDGEWRMAALLLFTPCFLTDRA
jgi:hypothetical protein